MSTTPATTTAATTTSATTTAAAAATPLTERPAASINGWPVLVGALAAVAGAAALFFGVIGIAGIVLGAVLVVIALFAIIALRLVAPNEPKVLQLLGGSYSGTVRTTGLRAVNPLASSRTVSTRIRNLETERAKVNDADGNPIEISAVVVWQVADTAQASFEVDHYPSFVAIQADAAIRHIASIYPYDATDRVCLRQNADDITGELSREISTRVAAAGVTILESRLNGLSYAPEIASVMLRRQQAGAVIAARKQIVEGAVDMVGDALDRLEANDVTLDPERRAAMVSNLLVVLCGDRDAQPVVNTGSLYQ